MTAYPETFATSATRSPRKNRVIIDDERRIEAFRQSASVLARIEGTGPPEPGSDQRPCQETRASRQTDG